MKKLLALAMAGMMLAGGVGMAADGGGLDQPTAGRHHGGSGHRGGGTHHDGAQHAEGCPGGHAGYCRIAK